jgi:hypothetical protein
MGRPSINCRWVQGTGSTVGNRTQNRTDPGSCRHIEGGSLPRLGAWTSQVDSTIGGSPGDCTVIVGSYQIGSYQIGSYPSGSYQIPVGSISDRFDIRLV